MAIKITRIILILCFLSTVNSTFSQCEIVATALPQDIICGTCVTLSAFGEGQGNSVFTESFNTGAPTGWQSTASATYTNPCDPGGVDGTPHLWMGDATGVPRQMTTNAFDFTTATAGATICFDMLFAEQGDASPCEGPDEPDEGVYLEYSIDGGATWITIHYFDPNGGNDASLVNWNNWCFPIPAAALTASTQIRWFQDNDSGADYDHWGLDNVNIYFNDPTFNITWQHDNYSYGVGNSGGPNPTQVCPQVTTTYTVTMTNGTSTCTDQVTVNVVPPVFRVNASPDTTICAGQCVDLDGEATIIVSPAKTPTYDNSEISTLLGFPSASDLASLLLPCLSFGGCNCPDGSTVAFGASCPTIFTGSLSMNINITDLNTTTLQNGELTSVCIGDALMVVGDLSPFDVTLTCPSGSTITLANAGDLSGTLLNNTCFDLTSTTPVASGTSPYSGTFQPINPLTNLSGCDANGVWTLTFSGQFDLASGTIPAGFLNGWDITFDDPEIIYTGIYNWSPTTNMTNATSLTPNVCPTADQTYTLLVTDSAGCASDSAEVTVNVVNTNCCPFTIDYTTMAPSCGNSDGSIDVTINNGSGNYTYAWSNSLPATQDAANLAAGSYTITVTDVGLGCQKDTTISISAPNSPLIDTLIVVGTTCGLNNGSVAGTVSGGTIPYSYSIDGGTTTSPNASFTNLASGNYVYTVVDDASCSDTMSFTIAASSATVIDSTQVVATSCGLANGSIDVFASGTAPLSYSIDNGTTFVPTSSFANLADNTYQVVVSDASGCSDTLSVVVAASTGLTFDSAQVVNALCLQSNGQITVFTSGGLAPLSYSLDSGATVQASNVFMSLPASSYNVYVEDAAGCSTGQAVAVNSANGPNIDSVIMVDPSCTVNDGSITIFATGGTAPLTYSIDSGATVQAPNSFAGLAGGNYNAFVTDATGCTFTQTVNLQTPSGPALDSVVVVDASCGLNNGSINIFASGGLAPLTFSIDSNTTTQATGSFNGLTSGTYVVFVAGANGCFVEQTVSVNATNGPSFDAITLTNTSCGSSNGSINISVSGGTAPFNYSIDNGVSTQATGQFNNLGDGTYTILVQEQGNLLCQIDSVVIIDTSSAIVISNVIVTDETCLGANDGSIEVQASGGQAPLSISLNGLMVANPSTNLSADDYEIIVQDAAGCTAFDTVTVNPGTNVNITTINDTLVEIGTNLDLPTFVTGSTSGTYVWSPALNLSCTDCASPVALISEDIIYTVVYTDDTSGCTGQTAVNIEVILADPYCLFPDAFSPNDDGINDGFGAICEDLELLELKIYNRWGELIYHSTANVYFDKWDGTYKGKNAPLDTYVYVANIRYLNGDAETVTGNFTLIR